MKSLKDKIIISTRPLTEDDALKQYLSSRNSIFIDFPMIEIRPVELSEEIKTAFQYITEFNWIIFTSKNGVKHFIELLNNSKIDQKSIQSVKTAVIGIHTAEELKKNNIQPTFISKGNTSDDLLVELSSGIINKKDKVLLALGNLASDKLEKELGSHSVVKRINVYNTVETNNISLDVIEQVKLEMYDLVVFTSPSGFDHFINLFKGDHCLENLKIACIGKTTEKAIIEKGYKSLIVSSGLDGLTFAKGIEEYLYNEMAKKKVITGH